MSSKPESGDATAGVEEELDVRELDGTPFEHISAALSDLGPDEQLRIVNSFEPAPLYDVLEQRGFEYESTQVADDEWHVLVERAT